MAEFVAHKVYTDHLSRLKKGVALYYPEPDERTGQFQIGDIGVFVDGVFKRLFNVMTGSIDENPVPDDLENAPRLRYDPRLETSRERYLDAGVYSNMDIKSLSAGAQGGVNPAPLAGAGAGYSFETNKASGGVLYMPFPGEARFVHECQTFVDYIRKHHMSWYHFAKEIGFRCEPEDVLITRGSVRTPKWTVAALQHRSQKHSVFLNGQFTPMVGAGIQFSLGQNQACLQESRTGPVPSDATLLNADPTVIPPSDQCVFLPVYKVKYRPLMRRKIEAAAGYDELPPGEGPEGGAMQIIAEPESSYDYAPLDVLLTYILEAVPDAEMAIACEEDLEYIMQDQGNTLVPEDFAEYVAATKPKLSYNPDTRVAMLSLEDAIEKRRTQAINRGRAKAGPHNADNDVDMGGDEDGDDNGTGDPTLLNPLGDGLAFLKGRRPGAPGTKWPHIAMIDPSADGSSVSSIAISPNGTSIATGMDDSVVRIWNYRNGSLTKKLNGHEDTPWALSFSPDGTRLASASGDHTIIIWDVTNEQNPQLRTLEGHESDVWTVAYSPDGKLLASGSTDATVRVWDAETGDELHSFPWEVANIMQVLWTPDSTRVVSCAGLGGKVWNVTTGEEAATFTGHTHAVWCMHISPQGDRLVTGSEDCTARIWDLQTGQQLVTLGDHEGAIWSVMFSPDGTEVVSGGYDNKIVVSNSFTGEAKHTWLTTDDNEDDDDDEGGSSIVDTVAFSKQGDLIACGGANGRVRLYSNRTGDFVAQYKAHIDKVKSVSYSRDDLDIISASDDGSVRVFNIADTLQLVA